MLIFTTSVSIYYKIRTSIITLLKETFISELVFLIAVDFPFFIVSLTLLVISVLPIKMSDKKDEIDENWCCLF